MCASATSSPEPDILQVSNYMTKRLLEAIYFATNKHLKQKRKDKITPYISHPLGVALILSTISKDEDIVIAGVLHDVVEDTDTTPKEIEKLFGIKVAKLVLECSEKDRSLSWKERKDQVLDKIKTISDAAALIKSADVLHNLYEINEKIKEQGVSFMNNFNASFEDKLIYEHNRLEKLKTFHPNPLLKDVEKKLRELDKFFGGGILTQGLTPPST